MIGPRNEVTLSNDRTIMKIRHPQGTVLTLEKDEGFEDSDVRWALTAEIPRVEEGQISRARKLKLPGQRSLYLQCNTGPPTWWLPRMKVRRRPGGAECMIGWLRGLVAVRIIAKPTGR